MTRYVVVGVLALAAVSLGPHIGRAQSQNIDRRVYGAGTHAYFAGNYDRALKFLSKAIEMNNGDPRYYYFRAATLDRLDRDAEAVADLAKGALLEMETRQKLIDVNQSIQRLQGPLRVELERHRAQAKAAADERKLARVRARYERLVRAEKEVLFDPTRESTLAPPKLPEDAANNPDDPFLSGRFFSGGEVTKQAAPMADAGEPDPFTNKPPEKPADPFDNAKPDPKANPFGTPPPATQPKPNANPFGNPPATPPANDGNAAPMNVPGGPGQGNPLLQLLRGLVPQGQGQNQDRDPFGDAGDN